MSSRPSEGEEGRKREAWWARVSIEVQADRTQSQECFVPRAFVLARRDAEVVCFAGLGVFASLLLLETHAHAMPVLGVGASATTAAAWQPLPVGFSPSAEEGGGSSRQEAKRGGRHHNQSQLDVSDRRKEKAPVQLSNIAFVWPCQDKDKDEGARKLR